MATVRFVSVRWSPALEAEFALVWKRYAVFSRASEYFLRQLREELGLPPDWFEA